MATIEVDIKWLQSIADHNLKIHSLANLIEDVSRERIEKEGINVVTKTAELIHELSDKIYDILQKAEHECVPENLNEELSQKGNVSFKDGTHNHYYNIHSRPG